MRVLWSINNLVPDIAKKIGIQPGHAISWIDAMSKQLLLQTDVQLAMATVWNVEHLQRYEFDGIVYYIFPRKDIKHDYWGDIIYDFKPDVIHAYGTELPHNVKLLENHNEVPILVSLQGILTEYARHYYGGIDFSTMLRYTHFKDFLLPTGFFSGKKDFLKRSKSEQRILSIAKYVEGRSTWDKVAALKINPHLKYFYLPRMIREPFYEKNQWDINNIERHTLLVHQGGYPIKGLHFMLQALAMLKPMYPDIKLYIAGNNIFQRKGWKSRLRQHSYLDYLKDLIKELGVEENIQYTGTLNADQMAEKLSMVHVSVLPSAIENSPNSIAEAQLVGTPCVASFVGGNMDMITHKETGLLYCFNEPNMLAEYVRELFESDTTAMSISERSREAAHKRHERTILVKNLLAIYEEILANEVKK